MAQKRLKPDERHALQSWEETIRGIFASTSVNQDDTFAEIQARKKRLEADDEAWFAYYFEQYYKSEPAPFHRKATTRIMKHARWYEVRAWARELAKSARSMMEITKLALTGQIRNILLISNSQDNAIRLLNPIRANLEANNRIKQDYGIQQKIGDWEDKEFTTLSGVAFRAIGAGQSPRGTRKDEVRPDFILIDDIDTDEETRNTERIKDKWTWLESALVPTMSMSNNYRILFNGNIIAKDCCITRAIAKANELKEIGIGHADIINIRDKYGKSSWQGKNSEEDIDLFLSIISAAAGQREFYNNPVSEGDVFKEMVYGDVPPLNKFRFLVAYADPSPSNNKTDRKNSTKALWLIGALEGKFYVITGRLDRVTNDEFVDWFYEIEDYVKGKTQIYNYIENNTLQDPFYEQVFLPLFFRKGQERAHHIGVIPDTRKKPDKFSRIEGNLEPLNRTGRLILNIKEKDNPHMKRLEEQFLLVSPALNSPADGPDAVEGGVFITNNKMLTLAGDTIITGILHVNKKRY
ncbi:MAG TPA: hypothetical protein DEG28_01055 [Porphyromonadaceae bacterium]|nr:hypothetical protein [Porphyromonadaceae bacterium]